MREASLWRHILCVPTAGTFWKRQNYRDGEQISGCQGEGWDEDWNIEEEQQRELGEVMDVTFILIVEVVTRQKCLCQSLDLYAKKSKFYRIQITCY